MKFPRRGFEARLAQACQAMAKFIGRILAALLIGHTFLLASAQAAAFAATPLYVAYSIRWFFVVWGPGDKGHPGLPPD